MTCKNCGATLISNKRMLGEFCSEQEGKPPRGTTRGLSPDEFKAMAEKAKQNTILQERLNNRSKQLSESEIEKLAETEYPYEMDNIEVNVRMLLRRQDFIKGYKAALTATPQQADEV